MFKTTLRHVAALSVLSMAAIGSAQAATTFTFNASAADANSRVFTLGGLTLTVTPSQGKISSTTGGLGVTPNGMSDLNHGEGLTFTFSQNVLLTGFSLFDTVDTKPNGQVAANEGTNSVSVTAGAATPVAFNWTPSNIGVAYTTVSLPAATTFTISSMDSLRIRSVTVADVPVVTPVPEAETYALALAGLGVVGLLARRRRA